MPTPTAALGYWVSVADDDSGAGAGCAIIGGCDFMEVRAEVEVEEDRGATNTSANAGVSEEVEDTFVTPRTQLPYPARKNYPVRFVVELRWKKDELATEDRRGC